MNDEFRLRRSVLFMPGDSMRKIEKATQLDADTIVMDLEDGVALNNKTVARTTIAEALRMLDFGRRDRLVRLNPPDSGFLDDDIAATAPARPDGFVIPKVESAADVQTVSRKLAAVEAAHGWAENSLRLLAVVETALGIMNLKEIAQADARLDALMFGAEDLAGDIGAVRTRAGWEVFFARSAVVTAAAAYGLQAIDMIFVDFQNLDGLATECRTARQMGYAGKMAIHPKQIAIINREFSPTPAEIERAQRLVAAHRDHQQSGTGAFAFEGKMVDMPLIRAAEHVLAIAREIGRQST